MKAPALLALLLLAPASAQVAGVDASAAGTARITVMDPFGSVACEGAAAFAAEANALSGLVAWDAPGCDAPGASGAVPFAFWCTDACFQDCWFQDDAVTCERGVSLDFSFTRFTLERDGGFTFERFANDAYVSASGTLLVATWPS